jgi:hypothetical protein
MGRVPGRFIKRSIRFAKRHKKHIGFFALLIFALYIIIRVTIKLEERREAHDVYGKDEDDSVYFVSENSKRMHRKHGISTHRALLSDDDGWPSFDGTYHDVHDVKSNETVAEILCKQRQFVIDEPFSSIMVYSIVGGLVVGHSVVVSLILLILSSNRYVRKLCGEVFIRCKNKIHRQRIRSKNVALSDYDKNCLRGVVTEKKLKGYHELKAAFDDSLFIDVDIDVEKKVIACMANLYFPITIRRAIRIAALLLPFYTGLTLFYHMILPHVFATRLGLSLEMVGAFVPSNFVSTVMLIKGYRDERMHISCMLKVLLIYFLLCVKIALPGFLSLHMVPVPALLSMMYAFFLLWIQMTPLHFSGTRGLDYFTNYIMEVLSRSKDTYDAFHKIFTLQWDDILQERRIETLPPEQVFSSVPIADEEGSSMG